MSKENNSKENNSKENNSKENASEQENNLEQWGKELEEAVNAAFGKRDLYVSFIDTAFGLTPTRTRVPESVFMEAYFKVTQPGAQTTEDDRRRRITLVDLGVEGQLEYGAVTTLTGESNFFTVVVTRETYDDVQSVIANHLRRSIEAW